VVREAIMAHWAESAGLQFGTPTNFQLYATGHGSNVLNRHAVPDPRHRD
jgi:hypothetical protein